MRTDLNGNEKHVLSFMLGFGDACRCSNAYIATCCGLKAGSVANIISKLRRMGLVDKRKASATLIASNRQPSLGNEAKTSLGSEEIVKYNKMKYDSKPSLGNEDCPNVPKQAQIVKNGLEASPAADAAQDTIKSNAFENNVAHYMRGILPQEAPSAVQVAEVAAMRKKWQAEQKLLATREKMRQQLANDKSGAQPQ